MFNAFQTADMETLIKAGQDLAISHSTLHYKATFKRADGDKVILNYSALIDRYYDYLQKIIVEIELTDEEIIKYRFQPKKLSFDFYGTTELWSSILRINNIASATQFTKQKVKMFTEDIFDVLNEIMILEEDAIEENKILAYGR